MDLLVEQFVKSFQFFCAFGPRRLPTGISILIRHLLDRLKRSIGRVSPLPRWGRVLLIFQVDHDFRLDSVHFLLFQCVYHVLGPFLRHNFKSWRVLQRTTDWKINSDPWVLILIGFRHLKMTLGAICYFLIGLAWSLLARSFSSRRSFGWRGGPVFRFQNWFLLLFFEVGFCLVLGVGCVRARLWLLVRWFEDFLLRSDIIVFFALSFLLLQFIV